MSGIQCRPDNICSSCILLVLTHSGSGRGNSARSNFRKLSPTTSRTYEVAKVRRTPLRAFGARSSSLLNEAGFQAG